VYLCSSCCCVLKLEERRGAQTDLVASLVILGASRRRRCWGWTAGGPGLGARNAASPLTNKIHPSSFFYYLSHGKALLPATHNFHWGSRDWQLIEMEQPVPLHSLDGWVVLLWFAPWINHPPSLVLAIFLVGVWHQLGISKSS